MRLGGREDFFKNESEIVVAMSLIPSKTQFRSS